MKSTSCLNEVTKYKMNEDALLMPSWYEQSKVYLYHFLGVHAKYITLFKNESEFMSVEINRGHKNVYEGRRVGSME